MKKKNFKTGFDTLLGDDLSQPLQKEVLIKEEIRATYIVKKSHNEKLKNISFWERKKIKNVLDEALTSFFEDYEKKNGTIQSSK